MAGFVKLSKAKETLYVGMTSRMYHDGKTPEEIASKLKQPIQRVVNWIDIIKKVDKNRKTMNS